jgi:SAM-dependent methyltransferase
MEKHYTPFTPRWWLAKVKQGSDRVAYRVGVLTGLRDPLIPPRRLHSVGGGDFVAVGEEFFRYFLDLARLEPHERVLDIGCGTGRMARPLSRYLTAGSYDGIDIVAPSIAWCQKTYARHCPNEHFRFHALDAYNRSYNPAGKYRAAEYRFPFADSSVDFTFLTSVFTHMLPEDMEQYVREIVRMLKPGGRCLITYFLLDPGVLQRMAEGLTTPTFDHELPGYRVSIRDVPEAAVAYDEARIRDLYQKHGLQIADPVRYGSWSGRQDFLSYQDIILASKRG